MQPVRVELIQNFLKFFFRLLYHQFAWTYDLVAWLVSVGQWNDWVASTLPFLAGARVLELGHGPGHLQVLAANSGVKIFGLDISPQMGKICRRRMLKHGLGPLMVRGSGVFLPFPEGSFSTLVATFPAEYIVFPETLEQIYRVLEPGGRFVLLPLAWITGSGMAHRLTSWLFRFTGQSVEVNHPALGKGLDLIRQAGFAVSIQTRELKHSKVLILLAEKPAGQN